MPLCGKCQREAPEGALFCPFCGAAIVPPRGHGEESDPLVGQTIRNTYLVQQKLGGGGMGQVYKAIQINLDRPVALKLLRPWFHSDPKIVQRFHREARASSKLHHPNVLAVLDFGQTEDGTLFMAMEYLPGRNLAAVLRDASPLPERRAVHLTAQILSALAEAHAAGIVHRDLKPANVMVESQRDESDFVKVVDFGIAKIQEPGDGEGQLTQPGLICGTPDYLSPEQAFLLPIDARSDLYSVGVLLYEMLAGRHPFDASTPPAMAQAHMVQNPPPIAERSPTKRTVSPALEALVMRALAKKAEERFQTAEEMRRELLECPLDQQPAQSEGASPRGQPATPRDGTAAPQLPSAPAPVATVPPSADAPASPGGASSPEALADAEAAPAAPPRHPEPATARRPRRLALSVVFVGLAAGAAYLYLGRSAESASPGDPVQRAELEQKAAPPHSPPSAASETSLAAAQPSPVVAAPPGDPERAAADPGASSPSTPEPADEGRKTKAPSKNTRETVRAPRAAGGPSRGQDRKRVAAVTRGGAPAPGGEPARANPSRTATPEAPRGDPAPAAASARREAFVTRDVLSFQQSFGNPELKARGRGLVSKARWVLEPNGTFVFSPADEAPGFFPLTARATREGSRVSFDGSRTARASAGPAYVRISGDLVLTGEHVLTLDLEFGHAKGKDGAELEPTYRARARLRLAQE